MTTTLESLQEDYLVALALYLGELTLALKNEPQEGKRYRLKQQIDLTVAEIREVKQKL